MLVLVLIGQLLAAPPMPRGGAAKPRPLTPAVRECEDIDADAKALLEEARACDGACEVVSFNELLGPGTCVGAFQCSTALPVGSDRKQFVTQAKKLAAEKMACGQCTVADCVSPEELDAVCEAGRCVLKMR